LNQEDIPYIPVGEETNRLAVVNIDWDRVKALDLLVLSNSFLPTNGVAKSVTIYFSDFGLEQIEKVRAVLEWRQRASV